MTNEPAERLRVGDLGVVVDQQGPHADRVVDPRAHRGPVAVDLAHPGRSDHPEGVEPPVREHVPHLVRRGVDGPGRPGHVPTAAREAAPGLKTTFTVPSAFFWKFS